eukprot:523258_1
MFWEGEQESLTVQFLQFIDWKTKDPPPPQILDELLSVVGTVDIVGLHLLTHILKQYYFEMCNVLTLELDFNNNNNNNNENENENANETEKKKIITESVLIVTKLCLVICKMPNLQSLHLSFNNFPSQCYNPCIEMFNNKSNEKNILFFPSLQQIFLNSSIFYVNEENDNFITNTPWPINDYNINEPTNGYWSDEEKNEVNIQQLMNDYNVKNTNNINVNINMNDWQCNICTLINDGQFIECGACGEPRIQINNNQKTKGGNNNNNNILINDNNIDILDDDDIDDEKLLTMDDDEKSIYFPFVNFLATHLTLKSVSIHINKRGKNGISLMNRILLSIAKRKNNLETFYIDCDGLHLNYCIKYLVLAIKQHNFKRFSCHFLATDERSVSKIIV